ncbi:hypothetical protein EZZ75_09490 [Neisseria meningitidis]|nr:hypothetical protein [Neisseria meningitidis]
MPSEGSDGIGAGESAGCRMGFSLPFPSIPHFYRFHRIHRIRPFRRPSPTQLNRHSVLIFVNPLYFCMTI